MTADEFEQWAKKELEEYSKEIKKVLKQKKGSKEKPEVKRDFSFTPPNPSAEPNPFIPPKRKHLSFKDWQMGR